MILITKKVKFIKSENKTKKIMIILITIIIIIAMYMLLLTIDYNRFRNLSATVKPLIVLKSYKNKNCIKYYGLGYSIEYKYQCSNRADDLLLCQLKSSKYILFKKIILVEKKYS